MKAITLLKRYQRENKLSQIELAERLGVSASMVSVWLSRKRGPSIDTAAQIEARTGGAVPMSSWARRPAA